MTGAIELFCNTGYYIQPHEVVLNRLDFWHENNGRKVFYPASEFEKALPTFSDLPVVLSNKHPDKIGQIPFMDAISEVNGKQIGTLKTVRINNMGSPDLRGTLEITDPIADELIKNGKAYLSSAFTGLPGSDGKLTDIVGNHILVYPAEIGLPPNDNAALFLNQSPKPGLDDTIPAKEVRKTMSTEEKNDIDPTREMIQNQSRRIEEQATLIANQSKEIEGKDKEIAEKAELIANQSKEIEGYKTQLSAIKAAEKAKERELLLNTYDKGVIEKYKDRLPELDDPEKSLGLIVALNQAQTQVPKFEVRKAEGDKFFNQSPNNEPTDAETEAAWTASNLRF